MKQSWGRALIASVVLGCGTQVAIDEPSRAPVATIVTPLDGSSQLEGRVELRGVVSDPSDPPGNLFTVWAVGDEESDAAGDWVEACTGLAQDDGTTLCAVTLTPSDSRIRLVVTDPAGFVGSAEVAVLVGDRIPPEVTLLSPQAGDPVFANVPLAVAAQVVDDADAPYDLTLSWRVEGEGTVDGPTVPDETGLVSGTLSLSPGQQRLTLTATDLDGAVGSASIDLVVQDEDSPPTCRITAPASGAAVQPGDAVALRGSVGDDVTAADDLMVVWRSSLDGVLATPRPQDPGYVDVDIVAPSLGEHLLTLEATDGRDATCVAETTLWVDEPPSLSWTSPEASAVLPLGQPVVVEVEVSDATTSADALLVTVSSDRDGPRGQTLGQSGVTSLGISLSEGLHQLTVTVEDGLGLQTSATRDVTVETR